MSQWGTVSYLIPLVQSQWAGKLSKGWSSSSSPSGGTVWTSHTDITPSVSPLSRYLPDLQYMRAHTHTETPVNNKTIAHRSQGKDQHLEKSSAQVKKQKNWKNFSQIHKLCRVDSMVKPCHSLICFGMTEVLIIEVHLQVQVKVDALVSGHIPLK